MDGALLNWREGFGTARKKRTTAGPKKQKARQTVALAQKKERVPPLAILTIGYLLVGFDFCHYCDIG